MKEPEHPHFFRVRSVNCQRNSVVSALLLLNQGNRYSGVPVGSSWRQSRWKNPTDFLASAEQNGWGRLSTSRPIRLLAWVHEKPGWIGSRYLKYCSNCDWQWYIKPFPWHQMHAPFHAFDKSFFQFSLYCWALSMHIYAPLEWSADGSYWKDRPRIYVRTLRRTHWDNREWWKHYIVYKFMWPSKNNMHTSTRTLLHTWICCSQAFTDAHIHACTPRWINLHTHTSRA